MFLHGVNCDQRKEQGREIKPSFIKDFCIVRIEKWIEKWQKGIEYHLILNETFNGISGNQFFHFVSFVIFTSVSYNFVAKCY